MALISPKLIDTHCHLHIPSYKSDLPELLQRMEEEQMWAIAIGTNLANSEEAIAFAEAHEGFWASVGLHPEHLSSSFHDPDEGEVSEYALDVDRLRQLARSSPKVVALGETGLDLYRIDEGRSREDAQREQEASFITHLNIAEELGLPIVIHCREALDRLAEILEERIANGHRFSGVVHSFTGTWEEAERLIRIGCYIALNGIATFPAKKTADPMRSLDRTILAIPLERLLLETDAPFLAPAPYRGKRNEPSWVLEVAKYIALKRGMELEALKKITTENAKRLFKLS